MRNPHLQTALATCLFALASCAADDEGIVLVVHGNLEASQGITRVETIVHERDGGVHASSSTSLTHALDASQLLPVPFDILVEKNAASEAWISVHGYADAEGTRPLVSYQLRAPMPNEGLEVVEVPLGKACLGHPCGPEETCYPRSVDGIAAGTCGPIFRPRPPFPRYRSQLAAGGYAATFVPLAERAPEQTPADGPPPDTARHDEPPVEPKRTCDQGKCITVANQARPFAMNQLIGTRITVEKPSKIVAVGMFVELQDLLTFQTSSAQATRVRMALYGQLEGGTPSQLLGQTPAFETVDALPLGIGVPTYATQHDLIEPVHVNAGELWLFFVGAGRMLLQGNGNTSAWLAGAPGGHPFEDAFPKYPDQHTRPIDPLDTTFSPFTAAVYVVTEEPTSTTGE